jgi:hypothetical protein
MTLENVARALAEQHHSYAYNAGNSGYTPSYYANLYWRDYVGQVKTVITALREPTYAITRAMAESRARDDEGEFEPLLDLIDFSGENKTHTVLAQAWRDAIDAILRD